MAQVPITITESLADYNNKNMCILGKSNSVPPNRFRRWHGL